MSDSSRPAGRWTHFSEERLRKEFLAEVRKKCDAENRLYLACCKEAGFLTPFKCREDLAVMNTCLHQYTGEAQWDAYKLEKKLKWVEEGVLRPDAQVLAHYAAKKTE